EGSGRTSGSRHGGSGRPSLTPRVDPSRLRTQQESLLLDGACDLPEQIADRRVGFVESGANTVNGVEHLRHSLSDRGGERSRKRRRCFDQDQAAAAVAVELAHTVGDSAAGVSGDRYDGFQPLLHAEQPGPGEMCMRLHGLHVKVEELTEYRLQVVTHVRCGGCLCHDGLALAYSGQLLLRMMATKSSRTNDGSKWASTSAFTVPKVVL